MRHYNYQSDFSFLLDLTDSAGAPLGWPAHDWELIIRDRGGRAYRAGVTAGKALNCREEDGRIRIVCDRHGLGLGELRADFHDHIPNVIYADGTETAVAPISLGIELVAGAGDDATEAEVAASIPVVVVNAYAMAVAAGYEGTEADYVAALTRLPQSVAEADDAEAARAAAEAQRETAETARVEAEAQRETAETARVEAEAQRETAETARAAAEVHRVDAEDTRAYEFDVAQGARGAAYAAAEDARDAAYKAAEATRNAEFNSAQEARTTAFNEAETARDATVAAAAARADAAAASVEDDIAAIGSEAARNTHDIDAIIAAHYDGALPTLCGQPPILFGAGAPVAANVPYNWHQFDPTGNPNGSVEDGTAATGYNWNGSPSALGQQYYDVSGTTAVHYIAVRSSFDPATAAYYTLIWKQC